MPNTNFLILLTARVWPHAFQSLVPSPDSETNGQRSKANKEFIHVQAKLIFFLGAAVVIVLNSSVGSSIGGFGYIIHRA